MSDAGSRAPGGRSNMELARLLGMGAAGLLVAAFALLNTEEVEVDWIFGTFRTPLIIVILVCLAVGLVVGLIGGRRMSSGRRTGKP